MTSMNNFSNFNNTIAPILFSLLSSLVVAANEQKAIGTESLAPEASVAEANLSFQDLPYLEEAFIDTAPADREDDIAVGELGIDGGNQDMIVKLAREIADNKLGSFDSLLVAQKGKLVFESYFKKGRVNLPHPQASATKTYTSLALGRAIQMGYLTMADLDKPLVSFLKDLDPTTFVAGAEKITLQKALTMRGGLRVNDEKWTELSENPSALQGQAQVQVLLEHSAPVTLESQSFSYGNFNPELVMQVIDAVVPGTAKNFIKNELLDKMGITNYEWQTAVSGLPEAGWRVSMTSRDMVKFGTLAMNKGKWNGEQLVPEAFIANSTNKIVPLGQDDIFFTGKNVSNPGYGYFWWRADMKTGDKIYSTASAQGGGGQYIILIDELDLIVVTTAHKSEDNIMQVTADRILPAFIEQP